MKMFWMALSVALAAFPSALAAETPPKPASMQATPLEQRIEQLPSVLAGTMEYGDYFSPSFLNAVPAVQLKTVSDQFNAVHGKPLTVTEVQLTGPNTATIKIEYEKAIATADISVEPALPNRVVGLLVKGFETRGDTPAKIDADFTRLPGRAGYLVEKIGPDGKRQQIAGRATGEQFAVASTFKLYVLAELASQVQAGRRSWSDVVPIIEKSYSSLATQNWPRSTPVTLQTLATWMISVSDNAATDALMRVLGRDAVEEKLATIGHSDPDKALPMLTTVEAFALKTNVDLRTRFQNANEAAQRNLLGTEADALKFERIDPALLGSGPVAIDSIEWFASPADIANVLDTIRRTGSQTALDIMTVNTAVGAPSAAKWQYLGYKGGSEPGVISMSFLAQSKRGEWHMISGTWNNAATEVDNSVFVSLMSRVLDSVAN